MASFNVSILFETPPELKDSPISDKEIKQGIESFKADFDSFKQLALQQYKEQQKLEREQQKTMKFRGMSR
jgi:hypothetical protein